MPNYLDLQENLGYEFHDVSLLRQAITHRSYAKNNNERLEFLGDGILDCLIALNLYQLFPNLSEGELSKMRSALVNQDGLVEIAEQLNVGRYIFLGDGEIKSGGRERPSILADCLEAIIAAIFLDGGFNRAREVVERLFYYPLREQQYGKTKDYKTQLQEYLQARRYKLPEYKIVDMRGPEHDMVFLVECEITELELKAVGSGKGKKQASQVAAYNVLNLLNSCETND
ncbi:MAG: ribonuclease III [Neisseriales bacterium]|nr:MAG: ribonuclease III [Neisseriales bacterium]